MTISIRLNEEELKNLETIKKFYSWLFVKKINNSDIIRWLLEKENNQIFGYKLDIAGEDIETIYEKYRTYFMSNKLDSS